MKWTKLGNIFNPSEHDSFNEYVGYAQYPHALVYDDFVRIYFAIRKQSENGKYLSYIQFIDMDKDLKKIINKSNKTVVELGKIGCFDEHGVFPMNAVRYKNKIYGYTFGVSRKESVVLESSIGLVISDDDGLTYKRIGNGPVLTSSINEPFVLGTPNVQIIDNVFHMWYLYGIEWKIFKENTIPERIYKLGHATSTDGINWTKEGRQIIADKFEEESQANPTVIQINNRYHMFFCYRQSFDFRKNKGKSYRIGYAYSDDLINWTRDDDKAGIDVKEGDWDSEMICYPNIFKFNENIYMIYNGNEFGKFGIGLARLDLNAQTF